ncbi:MAG: DsbA family protein [Beijerinckiaceae bacterium]
MSIKRLLLVITMMFVQPALTPASAQTASFSDAQKNAMHEIIKEYLLRNPEVIQDAMVELEKRQKEGERLARVKITQDKNGPLFASKHNTPYGNPKGDVTIVEFFDYNCGFCRRAVADLQKLVAEDKNVRVITKDFPVLGQESVEAATIAVALKQQFSPEKMWAFHQKLFTVRGKIGKQQALDTAKELAADMPRLTKDMENPIVRAAIEENVQIADALGLTGTPSYVVGEDIVVGAVGYADLKTRIDSIRKCGKSAC